MAASSLHAAAQVGTQKRGTRSASMWSACESVSWLLVISWVLKGGAGDDIFRCSAAFRRGSLNEGMATARARGRSGTRLRRLPGDITSCARASPEVALLLDS
jgi:hypothetical protein